MNRNGHSTEDANDPFAAVEGMKPRFLLAAAYAAVQSVEWPEPCRTRRETPEPVLRTLLTYCYSVRILSSQDVEQACLHDAAVRYICANDFPSWQTIREFRRRCLPGIAEALKELLLSTAPEMSEEAARFHAHQRVARAIQADSMALDV